MFDALLGKKFTNKCKHAIKCVGMRMLTIRKKKDAMLRFLRKDVADLIQNGLDENAFGRMDSLILEMNHALCYDMIAKFCEYIAIQLPSLQKNKECPPEAMEAVSTLIFAAARFSDLPELCDLRRLFTERYGSHMESSVNPEFIEKIQKKSFPVDKKLRAMQDIAQEFSVTWNWKNFVQKMSPESITDQPKKQKSMCNGNNESPHIGNSRKEVDMNMGNGDIPFKGRLESTPRCTVQKQVQPEPRDIHVPKSTVQKQVQPEPRDIRVVSSISNGQSRGYTEKARKVPSEDPKGVESVNMDSAFRPYVKPKGRENGSEKDDKGGIASNRSAWARAGKVFAKEPENIEPIKKEAAVHPYVKPKGSENGSEMNGQLKEGTTYNKSPWTKAEPGLIGLTREVVGSDKAVNLVTPYTSSNESKVEIHVDEHHEDHFAYRMQFAVERLGPMEQEKQPVARANSKNARPLSMIPPPYVKPNATKLEAHDRFIDGQSKNRLRDELYGVEKPKPVSVRRRQTKEQEVAEIESTVNNGNIVSQSSNGRKMHAGQQKAPAYEYDTDDREKMRGSDPKLPSGNETNYTVGDRHVRRIPSGSRHAGGQSTRANGECEADEEEKAMDRLLRHYSKKGKDGDSSRISRSQRTSLTEDVNAGMVAEHHSHDKVHHGTRSFHPMRVTSLPLEPISPKETKGVARASTMQPDVFTSNDGRRCPRLPDYEELAARMNALRNA